MRSAAPARSVLETLPMVILRFCDILGKENCENSVSTLTPGWAAVHLGEKLGPGDLRLRQRSRVPKSDVPSMKLLTFRAGSTCRGSPQAVDSSNHVTALLRRWSATARRPGTVLFTTPAFWLVWGNWIPQRSTVDVTSMSLHARSRFSTKRHGDSHPFLAVEKGMTPELRSW